MKSAGIKILLFFIFFQFLSISWGQSPYDVTKKEYRPKKQLIHDFGELFDFEQKEYLENKLVAYNDSTSVQIVVVTFQDLEGYPIETLANEIGERWGVGQKDLHNGIVIVLSHKDRKVTIRGGYGIQAKMPPTVEKIIIDREMIPFFKEENYFDGVNHAIDAIQLQLKGQYKAKKEKGNNSSPGEIIFMFILIIVFLAIISKGNSGGGNTYSSGGRSNYYGGSWGRSSGGSSGGFGGFGGGSFGGGGASGSW